jgi:hypothetical protein
VATEHNVHIKVLEILRCVHILRCFKSKYLLIFSACRVFRHAGIDVKSSCCDQSFFFGLGVWIPGTYMLPRVAGFLEGRLPGTCWLLGALLLGAHGLLESL